MTKRIPGLFVSAITLMALCMACGTAGSGGGDGGPAGGTGGTAGSGTGGSGAGGSGGVSSSTTQCGSTTCTVDQVCAQQGCGGIALPDSGPCTPPEPKCVPLPATCQGNVTCSCMDSIWATLTCGTIRYGTLQCAQPCA